MGRHSPISRNAQLLRFLLAADPGIGRQKLGAYVYLADVESIRILGRPLSTFRYIYDRHGPFDARGFHTAKVELEHEGLVRDTGVAIGRHLVHRLEPIGRVLEYEFTAPEREVLDHVVNTYLEDDARNLCPEAVFMTAPMRKASPGKPLPMDEAEMPGSGRGASVS